jgi:hypothetical protein
MHQEFCRARDLWAGAQVTTTQDDIDNGGLIGLIGIAAGKPAEFVIFTTSPYGAERSAAVPARSQQSSLSRRAGAGSDSIG